MLLASVSFLAGCSGMVNDALTDSVAGAPLKGNVHGGQNPVAGATVQLYTAAADGYGAQAGTLGSPVVTDSGGNFTLGSYICPGSPNDQVYIVAKGGNSGSGTNANLALMVALGSCTNLQSNVPFITVNEVTTVASTYALSGFMADYAHVGTSSTNYTGLKNAMLTVNNLVNIGTGAALSVTPAYASLATGTVAATYKSTVPQSEIYTLADILASCVNTNGVGGSSGNCAGLFASSATNTTTGGASGTPDTIQAALNIAKKPGANVSNIYAFNLPAAPFAPVLASAPNDWSMPLTFVGGGLGGTSNSNKSFSTALAIDGTGNIWVANSGTNKVTELNNLGVALSPNTETSPAVKGGWSASDLDQPLSIATDMSGNAWVGNIDGVISMFGPGGTESASVTGGGMTGTITGIAIDGSGRAWAVDYDASVVAEFNSSGSPVSPTGYTGSGIDSPNGGIAVDGTGNVWITNSGSDADVVKLSGSTGSVLASSSNVLTNEAGEMAINGSGDAFVPEGTLDAKFAASGSSIGLSTTYTFFSISNPGSISVDGAGNLWTANAGGASGQEGSANLTEISNGGSLLSGTNGYGTTAINSVTSNQPDSSGNLWVLNASGASSVTEFVGLAAPSYVPLAAAVAANKIGQMP
jgi:hypothetical protein